MVNRIFADSEHPTRLSFVRIAAPLGFFVAITVLVLLVHSSLDATPAESQATVTAPTGDVAGASTTKKHVPKKKRRYYVVRSGDTLGGIADRYRTTVDDLLRLNPKIDQYNLTPGERVRVH